MDLLWVPLVWLFHLFQKLVIALFSPKTPKPHQSLLGPRVAVIGAGLSGVSGAAHCIGYGCDVMIFERHPRDGLGGIWAQVNENSGLQISSVMYRFHPARIIEEIEKVWHRYGLEGKTVFNTPVTTVRRKGAKWTLNDGEQGSFDGVIAAIGTCGDPKMIHLPNQEAFGGVIEHSSRLDGTDFIGNRVVVIGGGASAVEALEDATDKGASRVDILPRSDKWLIPRNPIIDALLSLNIFGYENWLAWIPEWYLKNFFYRDLKDLVPAKKGLFESTPMCNDAVLDQIRHGQAEWLRGDPIEYTGKGILFNHRDRGVPKGGPGKREIVEADIVIYATGFRRPDLHFLPDDVFSPPYQPPAWYLQTFPPQYPTLCALNSNFVNAIGTVGHVHIGIYTRLLLMFLLDRSTIPSQKSVKRWIDTTRWMKKRAPTRAFDFFTYGEMFLWFAECILMSPRRWKWVPFVFLGWGYYADQPRPRMMNSI
ncbi:dimethylaniline monooxygenase (N-oxide forming) [Lineolata rhizophorae]|uniref:Dimethylaniline monooxygenase (N-oxide forming) n=1 Tax=Lineolata rhizophorae TaxID=578093 RepID=A0A6A6NPZ7_9PEZI|nr:dimethylaniline monooxygenase (N-oxide forming) [Lineolata rhizophorae]